ncbi:MAG: esterase-like activity of phytase family protein [Niveispirillum sp.]|uniref:esterase-like activity of phytase family protein n=1 Tax=Niveispirillum sp. TaxID=1917217 RepID=UPI003BA45220
MSVWRRLLALVPVVWLTACGTTGGPRSGPEVRFLGYYDMPTGLDLSALGMPGVPFGGISGIDRDPVTGIFHLISDDRSQRGPARSLKARIDADLSGIHRVTLLSATPLRDADGRQFAPSGPGGPTVDPESIRVDPVTLGRFWTSEGDADAGGDPLLMLEVSNGSRSTAMPLPTTWHFDPAGHIGPRPNMTLEGLALYPDGSLVLAMEGPQVQDGPPPSSHHGALTRLTRLTRTGQVLAQWAYPLDPISHLPDAQPVDNGVSEIAWLDDRHLLVLERAGLKRPDGSFVFDVRLYVADLTTGEDISTVPALTDRSHVRPVDKRLLFASGYLPMGLSPQNQEGMVLFPDPGTGRQLLLLVADDNFDQYLRSRFLLFVIGGDVVKDSLDTQQFGHLQK